MIAQRHRGYIDTFIFMCFKNLAMKKIVSFSLMAAVLVSCGQRNYKVKGDFIVANGQMPSVVKDKRNNLHVVYGSGDSIMYTSIHSGDTSFSVPTLIDVLPNLAAAFTRGPQISLSNNGLTVTACNTNGDIYSFNKTDSSQWLKCSRVNDIDTVAKENLMSLSGDGQFNYAIWLDLRGNKQNKIYGARTNDGGKTWSANKLIYASPDNTVCQCCKPSVIVKGSNVYVMFRNWIDGNRNMYLIQSKDSGNTFSNAEKLGVGNWKLNGCPMDGGGMAVTENGIIETVWRRESSVYSARPGMPEKIIGDGKGCTVEIFKNKPVYAWVKDGYVTVINSDNKELKIGKGNLPILKTLTDNMMICVWEYEKQVHAAIFSI